MKKRYKPEMIIYLAMSVMIWALVGCGNKITINVDGSKESTVVKNAKVQIDEKKNSENISDTDKDNSVRNEKVTKKVEKFKFNAKDYGVPVIDGPEYINYTVRPWSTHKDCLFNIAKRFYGNGWAYPMIYQANADQIDNPDMIYPGQVLRIPLRS